MHSAVEKPSGNTGKILLAGKDGITNFRFGCLYPTVRSTVASCGKESSVFQLGSALVYLWQKVDKRTVNALSLL